jgi:hypothetical protein
MAGTQVKMLGKIISFWTILVISPDGSRIIQRADDFESRYGIPTSR